MDLPDDTLQDLYCWVDQIPLSRPKRNIGRDFSDGVLVAEIVQHFYPRLVDMHNYTPTNAAARKAYNWATLNRKVFRTMGFAINPDDVDAVVNVRRMAIERVLMSIRQKMGEYEVKRVKKRSLQAQQAQAQTQSIHLSETNPGSESEHDCRTEPIPEAPCQEAVSERVKNDNSELVRQLKEKDLHLARSQQAIEILCAKVEKLEQLLALKDDKITSLTQHLEQQTLVD